MSINFEKLITAPRLNQLFNTNDENKIKLGEILEFHSATPNENNHLLQVNTRIVNKKQECHSFKGEFLNDDGTKLSDRSVVHYTTHQLNEGNTHTYLRIAPSIKAFSNLKKWNETHPEKRFETWYELHYHQRKPVIEKSLQTQIVADLIPIIREFDRDL
jgi:RNA processing factor Prp31